MTRTADAAPPAVRRSWFVSLFMLDMWERFSFFGMVAILYLFAVDSPSRGGLGLSESTAGALVATYIAGAFVAAVPGSWLGDRILGTRRASLWGAVGIAAGHLCLTLPATVSFYLGLLLIAAGTGLLKPNMTALLGSCYPKHEQKRRESGFSVFYMSIQISALLAPIVIGFLGERIDWHLGFGAAAGGMLIGILCFLSGIKRFGDIGAVPADPAGSRVRAATGRRAAAAVAAATVLIALDVLLGTFQPKHVVALVGLAVVVAPVLAFRAILRHPSTSDAERVRVRGYRWIFGCSAVFWALSSQSATVLTMFAQLHTDRRAFGTVVPVGWFQSLHPLFVLAGAPIAAALWSRIGPRAGVSSKFAAGLALAGVAYLAMAVAVLTADGPVAPGWLVATYLLQSMGELALAPIGLALTVAIAPAAFSSQMMGLWWLSAALGAAVGGQSAGLFDALGAGGYFALFGLVPIGVAAVLIVLRARLERQLAI